MVSDSTDQTWAFAHYYTLLRGYEAKKCKILAVLPEQFMKDSTLALGWPKNSFFADEMNAVIQTMTESDHFQKRFELEMKQLVFRPCTKQSDTVTNFSPTDMKDIIGIFALYGVFFGAALAVLAAERIWQQRRRV